MNLTLSQEKNVSILSVEGSIDSYRSSNFEQKILQLLQEGAKKILIDFSQLEYTSSAGLRVVLATAKKLKGPGVNFALCHLNESVYQVFELSGFTTILKIYKDRAEALAAMTESADISSRPISDH